MFLPDFSYCFCPEKRRDVKGIPGWAGLCALPSSSGRVSWPGGVIAVLEGVHTHQEAVAHIWLWSGVYFWLTTGAEAQNRGRNRTMYVACASFVQGNGMGMYNLTVMKCFLKRDLFPLPCRPCWSLAEFLCWVTGVGWGCSYSCRAYLCQCFPFERSGWAALWFGRVHLPLCSLSFLRLHIWFMFKDCYMENETFIKFFRRSWNSLWVPWSTLTVCSSVHRPQR